MGVGGAWTVTEVDALDVPPAPVHERVKVVLLERAGVNSEPPSAFDPLQPPEAVHEVALAVDHRSVVPLPATTVVASLVRLTVGAGDGACTATETVAVAVPPEPVHVSV